MLPAVAEDTGAATPTTEAETAPIIIQPQSGPQTAFLATSADIAIYGGAAGSGKTYGLLIEPLRHINNPHFGGVIFRRTSPQVTNEGGLWDESGKIYPLPGLHGNSTKAKLLWTFPPGSKIKFAHLEHEKDKYNWQGAQIPYMGFDELTHYTSGQFWYMLSRSRSTCGVIPYIRATTNPDADSWVADLIEWWIDQDTGYPIKERAGHLRWFVRIEDILVWADDPEELTRQNPGYIPKSLTFIPAKLDDNPALTSKDPSYLANLLALPMVERERLLYGNWQIRPSAGNIFSMDWYGVVDAVPAGGIMILAWDLASTEKQTSKGDPDYTAAVTMLYSGGIYYVLDCLEFRAGPAEVEKRFVNYSQQKNRQAMEDGRMFAVRWEIEPGSAGKRESPRLARLLAGMDARGINARGDKLLRARSLSAQSEAGNIKLLTGQWNRRWLTHMHGQPMMPHDDIMDASAYAFNSLTFFAKRSKAKSWKG